MATMDAVPTLRSTAQQRRSQATFEAILTAAGALFDEVGIEATTMEAIARGAGVSIGAVYRFFDNRHSIVATLALRWRDRIQEAALPQFNEESLRRGAEDVIGDFLNGFRDALDDVPGARGLLSSVVTHPTQRDTALWTAHLERFIERYAPGLAPARRSQAAYMYQVITTAVMVATATEGRSTTPMLQEIRSVLLGYTNQLTLEAAEGRGTHTLDEPPDNQRSAGQQEEPC